MPKSPNSSKDPYQLPVLDGRVLPTLNTDGTRRWVRPKLFTGVHQSRRKWVAFALMAVFAGLPLVHIGGKPAMLLDVVHREFSFFGATFHATDGVLLMLLMLTIFLGVFWLTSLLGRVWCGYGCPQTVYLEFLFRPIERWLEGSRGQQMKLDREGANGRRVLKYAIYAVLALILGNLFLSYFVGVKQLSAWLSRSPFEHPTPFLVMLVTAALVFFDFTYFREQMCTIICPYARLQSVMLDRRSLVVAYDEKRGEPRRLAKEKRDREGAGDCIDCKACVIACPTGIDIREGLQLECVACAQCVDACDGVMERLNKPLGLIRYASQASMAGESNPSVRWRTLLYPAMMSVLIVGLVLLGRSSAESQVTLLRGIGAPYVIESSGSVRNQVRVKIHNRNETSGSFTIALLGADGSELVAPENPLEVAADEQVTTTVFVESPKDTFHSGQRAVQFEITTEDGFRKAVPYKLLGPM